jgi:hypothetical protein
MIDAVSRSWFGVGPRRWKLDIGVITDGRQGRAIAWELALLVGIVTVIFVGLEFGQLLLGGRP